jgi:hypothetical protein
LSVKGERNDGTDNAKLDGSGYRAGFGYQFQLNKNIALGASIFYNAVSISSNIVDNIETEESESYSTITPVLEFNFRFF